MHAPTLVPQAFLILTLLPIGYEVVQLSHDLRRSILAMVRLLLVTGWWWPAEVRHWARLIELICGWARVLPIGGFKILFRLMILDVRRVDAVPLLHALVQLLPVVFGLTAAQQSVKRCHRELPVGKGAGQFFLRNGLLACRRLGCLASGRAFIKALLCSLVTCLPDLSRTLCHSR